MLRPIAALDGVAKSRMCGDPEANRQVLFPIGCSILFVFWKKDDSPLVRDHFPIPVVPAQPQYGEVTWRQYGTALWQDYRLELPLRLRHSGALKPWPTQPVPHLESIRRWNESALFNLVGRDSLSSLAVLGCHLQLSNKEKFRGEWAWSTVPRVLLENAKKPLSPPKGKERATREG